MRQCRKGDTSPLAYLLSLLQDGRTATWGAASGHLEALRMLLASGANPAAADRVRE